MGVSAICSRLCCYGRKPTELPRLIIKRACNANYPGSTWDHYRCFGRRSQAGDGSATHGSLPQHLLPPFIIFADPRKGRLGEDEI